MGRYCQRDGRAGGQLLAGLDEQGRKSVPVLPLVARHHSHGGDAVRAIPAVTAERGRLAVRAWLRPVPRDGATVVEQIWPDVRGRHSSAAGQPDVRLSPLALAP